VISVSNTPPRTIAVLFILTSSIDGQTVEPRKLTGTINEESSSSPDGKTTVFDSIRSGKLNIYIWRIDTRVETAHPN